MFKLLHGDLNVHSPVRKSIANKLLAADEDVLEYNTKKLRKLCVDDLRYVAKTGCLQRGCRLHAILAITAQNMSLDSGELESLNSMIKTAASTYTNMSLELLSSRVNARKTLTLAADGSRSLKDMKQVASSLANSSVLYQSLEMEAFVSDRWTPPGPAPNVVPYKAALVDPQVTLSKSARWAVKYNVILFKALRDNDSLASSGFSILHQSHMSVYLCCEVAGRTCQALLLEEHCSRTCATGEQSSAWLVPERLSFASSLRAIASVFEDLQDSSKKGIVLNIVKLKLCTKDAPQCTHLRQHVPRRLHYTILSAEPIATLRRRKEYTKRQRLENEAAGHALSAGDEALVDGDVDDEPHPELVRDLEQELYGECADDLLNDLDADWLSDQHNQDVQELDELNRKFVAAATERQLNSQQKSKSSSSEQRASHGDRQYEDEAGEEILRRILEQREDPADSAAAGSSTDHGHADILISDEQVDRALRRWADQLQLSLEACSLMSNQLESFEVDRLDTCLSGDIALLIIGGSDEVGAEACFVSWVKPLHDLAGRVVALDECGGAIFPSNFVPKQHFAGSILICPATGARVRKRRRDTMQESVCRLQAMFQCGLEGGSCALAADVFLSEDPMACAACGRDMSLLPLKRCSCCLMYWHDSCGKKAGQQTASFIATEDVTTLHRCGLCVADLPFTFLSLPELVVVMFACVCRRPRCKFYL